LKFVLSEEGIDELYGVRYFREHQKAIGHPPLESRWDSDAHDRIPFWLETIRHYSTAGSILEIGSSHGRFLLEASRAGYRAIGLELDRGIAEWARQKNDGVDVRPVRIEALQETGFDIVFAVDVLEHVYYPTSFVEESARVLRSGGHALFHTVVFDDPMLCPASMARPLFHPILYSRRSLANLQGGGFRYKGTVPGLFGCQFVVIESS
jgi:2-polyprenyl-3-methyl-5-hydroxy-6-metoxy-1,4-benzoquinol methylase